MAYWNFSRISLYRGLEIPSSMPQHAGWTRLLSNVDLCDDVEKSKGMEAIERARSKCAREFRLKKDSEAKKRQSSDIRRTNILQGLEHQIHSYRIVNSTSPLPSEARSRLHYSNRFLPSSTFCTFFCEGKINCVNAGLLLNYHKKQSQTRPGDSRLYQLPENRVPLKLTYGHDSPNLLHLVLGQGPG